MHTNELAKCTGVQTPAISRPINVSARVSPKIDPSLINRLESQKISVVFLNRIRVGSHTGNIKVDYGK
jgi:hypothetical protein